LNKTKKKFSFSETTNNNLVLISLMDILTVVSIAGYYISSGVPNLRLIFILNPFLYIVTFFISLILKLFLDGTTNKGITSQHRIVFELLEYKK
jgi:hypothetical protein